LAFGKKIDIRKQNKRNHIIDLFREHGPLSKARVRSLSGYSMDTVISIFNSLEEENLIHPASGEQKSRGRKAQFYSLNSDRVLYLGITFNQSGIHSSLLSFSHDLLAREHTPLPLSTGREDFIHAFGRHLKKALDQVERDRIAMAGCSLPGDIDYETGVLRSYSFMPGLAGLDIRSLMEEHLPDVPLFLDHNINSMMSYVIHENGMIDRYENVLFISARSGAANGLIYRGEIVTSRGEFGHVQVREGERECSCGRYGCLDCYFSYKRFLDILSGEPGMPREQSLEDNVRVIDTLSREYSNPGSRIRRQLEEMLHYFIVALMNVVNTTGPHLVILTGELLKIYGDPVAEIRRIATRDLPEQRIVTHFRDTEMVFRDLGTEIASTGVCFEMIQKEWGYSSV
jgi:predicted NBD/HSP70 family sugar kinase